MRRWGRAGRRHAALVLLANLAANAPTAQVAINTEMLALVTGPSPLVEPGHATDILTALHDAAVLAGNTAFVTILNAELAVLASSDPAIAVFNGLSTTTNHAGLETAAVETGRRDGKRCCFHPVRHGGHRPGAGRTGPRR